VKQSSVSLEIGVSHGIYSETSSMQSQSWDTFNKEKKFDKQLQQEKQKQCITTKEALIDIVFGKGVLSMCLLVMPIAVLSVYSKWSPEYVFWANFIVMIPLASILGDFTEEVALHTNETVGGLINASFGNAVEIIVCIQALLADEIRVVQASILGSIFSNLLLVLGCCFFFGGLYHKEQSFNATAASANLGLLALSSIAFVLPTPLAEYYDIHDEHVLIVSRVAAVFLIFMYIQLLIFQLKTHAYLFENSDDGKVGDDDVDNGEEKELAVMSLGTACLGLFIVTCTVALFSEFLVGSIDGFTESSGVSRTFVGIIILPIVGNAVEHVTAVNVSIKNKMDLAMGIAVGSCSQISLFVAPVTVLIGWACGKDMSLNFPKFEIAFYILAIFTVSVVCTNPRCNWLEGSLLITTYALIAVGFWFEDVHDYQK
jgi:Ca2+:H+ antiporter